MTADVTETQVFVDFCKFAKVWLIAGGSVQKNMVVYYFRQCFPNAYKYQEQASDSEIEECFTEWNKIAAKIEPNEMGMYIGLQLNLDLEKKIKEEEKQKRKLKKVKEALLYAKKTKTKPSIEILKEAVKLGIIQPRKKEEEKPVESVKEEPEKEKTEKAVSKPKKEKKKKEKKVKKDGNKDGEKKKTKKKKKAEEGGLAAALGKTIDGDAEDVSVWSRRGSVTEANKPNKESKE